MRDTGELCGTKRSREHGLSPIDCRLSQIALEHHCYALGVCVPEVLGDGHMSDVEHRAATGRTLAGHDAFLQLFDFLRARTTDCDQALHLMENLIPGNFDLVTHINKRLRKGLVLEDHSGTEVFEDCRLLVVILLLRLSPGLGELLCGILAPSIIV